MRFWNKTTAPSKGKGQMQITFVTYRRPLHILWTLTCALVGHRRPPASAADIMHCPRCGAVVLDRDFKGRP